MEFLGSELGTLARVVVALLIVLGLIALTIWLIRRFGPVTLTKTGVARGRQPRLALLESATVDARRRLVLIRRDNVEHLLLVGGPTDVVVEPNIVRAATMQTQPAPMPPAAREPIARAAGRPAMLDPLEEHESSLVPPPSPEPYTLTPEPAAELPPPPPPRPSPGPRPHRRRASIRNMPRWPSASKRRCAGRRRRGPCRRRPPPRIRPLPRPGSNRGRRSRGRRPWRLRHRERSSRGCRRRAHRHRRSPPRRRLRRPSRRSSATCSTISRRRWQICSAAATRNRTEPHPGGPISL